ncbi:hypothetical protein C8R45DRAFT_947179 [Mycena sanguinolenta]|nr:hypothetical protein C8R45DRAFT_947179 [Mycena sanguinolenta]
MVATTRAPNFAEDSYKDPLNGFRELGPYSNLSSVVPLSEFVDAADIPAATVVGPGATEYFEMWLMLPRLGKSSRSKSSRPKSISNQVESKTRSSASPARSPRQQSRSPSPYSTPSTSPKADLVFAVARARIPEFDSLQSQAKSTGKGNKLTPLASLGRCYSAMERILVQLGFDPQNPRSSKSLSFSLDDGKTVEFTANDVFKSCRWSSGTFSTKRKRYNLAKSIACREWKGISSDDPNATELHQLFLGIKYLWGASGPFTLLDIPLPSSDAEGSEKFAADPRQAHLDKCELLIDKYTQATSPTEISTQNTPALPT